MEKPEEVTTFKCVYCNTRPAITREHVVARCFFTVQPDDNVTVPTCVECNSGTGDGVDRPMSLDEEYVRTVLGIHAGAYGHEAAGALVWGKIQRSFKRRPGGLAKSIAETLRPTTLRHGSILIPGQSTISVDGARVVRVLTKMTRGLFYHHMQFPLPSDCDVFVDLNLPPTEFYEWLAMFRLCSFVGPFVRGKGVFSYMGIRDPKDLNTTVWLSTFYNRFTSMMVTARNKVRHISFGDPQKRPVMGISLVRGTPAVSEGPQPELPAQADRACPAPNEKRSEGKPSMTEKETFAQRADYVVESVRALGVKVAGGSRLDRMHRMLVKHDGTPAPYIPPDHPNFEVALEGLRDLQHLWFAFQQLSQAKAPTDMRERLRRVAKDAALPQDSATNTKGRDEQCELYVAAICAKADLRPTFEEPDLRCVYQDASRGMAIKRIKSYQSFRNRIEEAANQIHRANLPGVIVADVSVMLNPENERIAKRVTDEHFGAAAYVTMHTLVEDHHARMVEWTKGKGVQGIILLDHHVRQHPTDGWGLDSQTFGAHFSPHNVRRRREFDEFMQQFYTGLPTPPEPMRPK